MPKYVVAVARPTADGWERCEIGNHLIEICCQSLADPEVQPFVQGDIYHIPIARFPTSVARNALVQICRDKKVDFLYMLDCDGSPHEGTFKAMFSFLRQQAEPSVIGIPYVSSDGACQVFHFSTEQAFVEPLDTWKIVRYDRDVASLKTGIERVAAVGTHCVMFDMRVFDLIPKPYFNYSLNLDHTDVKETEDNYCMRHLFHAKVPIYCHWDYPAVHYKEIGLQLPIPVTLGDIPEFYTRRLRALEAEKMERENKHHEDYPKTV